MAICRVTPDTDQAAFQSHLADEVKVLQQWRAKGILLEAYSPGGPGAILILETRDPDEARALIDELPLAKDGLIETELVGLHPLPY